MIQSKMSYFLEAMKHSLPAEHRAGTLLIQVDIPDIPVCQACHTIGYSGEKFCPQCGTGFPLQPLQRRNARYCQQCRQPIIHPVAYFCSGCGVPLSGQQKNDLPDV